MRWWCLVGLCVGCSGSHALASAPPSALPLPAPAPSSPPPARLTTLPPAAAEPAAADRFTVADAIAGRVGVGGAVIAFLCQDQTGIVCPPCPKGANCGRCPEPKWLFCDTPTIVSDAPVLVVSHPPPTRLVVGRRYLLKGQTAGYELRLLSIDPVE
jgi:hypothetical protein